MRKITLRSSVLPALALAAALGLSGCGGSADAPASNSSSESSGSEETGALTTLNGDNFSERINDAQLKAGSVAMTMTYDVDGTPVDMMSEIEFGDDLNDFENVKMSMSMDMGDEFGMVDMVWVDGYAYVSMGAASEGSYLRASIDDIMASNPNFSEESLLPTASLDAYADAMEDAIVEEGGEVDGVETTKLTLKLDTATLAEGLGDDAVTAEGETVEVQMWVGNDDDLPRRIATTVQGTEATMNFTDWGGSFDIQAPPADQVQDMPTV